MSDGKKVTIEEWLDMAYNIVLIKGKDVHITADILEVDDMEGCELVIDLKIRKKEEVEDGCLKTDAE